MAPYLDPSAAFPTSSSYSSSDEGQHSTFGQDSAATPIAICGIALRLPGGIATPSQFWDFLVNKQDARGPIPETRFKASSFYSKSGKPGFIKSQYGYFLDESVDLGALDTSFFSIPKNEVERADPQQRLLLELARECFESAGETSYRGKAIGAYVGSFGEDWAEIFGKDPHVFGLYKLTGQADFVLSNRISYEYDLRGPSMTLRTGCSSALIGLHEACLAIRNGECNAALVGGCNLIMAPGLTVNMSEQGVLSPDGSCKTFDADANGYARGEAINLIYIKKLSDALRDGNPIRAVIRGTSTNADGKTTGITVPSYVSHEAMIRRAYSVAGLNDISETAFVECHGTGTPTGDPIEITAIANVFGDKGVFIGSVKPNVGHSEGASGITSLIKSVLALEHQIIPPNIKFHKPNPKIPFEKKKLRVPTEPVSWPEERRERISVNSFGIGGANVHVILESTNSFLGTAVTTTNAASPNNLHPQLLTFSANTADSLRRQVVGHEQYITEHPEAVVDIAYTLGARRVHLPHRAYAVIGDGVQFTASPPTKAPSLTPDIAMIFTGQGAQWPQMGTELLYSNASFKAAIRKMDKLLHSLPDGPSWSIMDELLKPSDETNLHKASISQPLCTAVQVALVDALANIGIRPYAVIGHSSGEIAAAYASGKLSANEAITYAYYRGVASSETSKPGSMAAVGMGWEEASEFLVPGAVIACENSPSSVTVSGDKSSVEDVLATIREAKPDTLVRELKVDRAYHSHHMKEVGDRYRSLASRYMCHEPFPAPNSALFFSSVTGTQLSASDPVDARYWQANLESPVLFRTATAKLLAHHKAHSTAGLVFLEVGPHSALAGPLRQTLAHTSLNSPYASCLIRSKNATQTFLAAVGQLWLQGISPDFNQLINPAGTARVVPDLPLYPWQHDHSLLFETRITKEWRFQKFPKHELLGVRVPESTDNEPVFRNVFLLDHAPWVRDHNIKGDVIFPCAGYVGMAGEAARQLCDRNFVGFSLRNVVIDTAMILNESKPVEIITSLRRERLTDSLDSSWLAFTVSSHNGTTWIRHCTGQVQALSSCGISTGVATTALPRSVNVSKWYRTLRNVGANYGPYFQGLKNVSCSTTEYISAGTALHTVQDDEVFYSIHPTKIDFFLQLFAVAVPKGLGHKLDTMTLPTFIEEMEVFNCDTEIDMTVSATPTTRGLICGGGQGLSLDGRLVLKTKGVKLSPLDSDTPENTDPHAGARISWQPDVDFLDISSLTQPHVDQQKYMKCCEELNRLCIQEALRRLENVVTEVPHLKQFHTWMRMQPSPNTNSTIDSLLGGISLTAMAPIAAAVTKVLNSIVSIFEGNVEPLDVLTQDDTLTKLYDCLNLTDRTKLFKSLGHAKPNLKILEIGAGTGGTTNAVLASLVNDATGTPMYGHYTYTDVSAGFFAAAKERFKGYPNMTFKVLDISKDPLFQGFESESYDLIIGANVLHATPSLKVTLANVRKLLHPEGRLYMEELCSDVKPFNFIMGILPGWWLGAGDDRLDEPYVPPERWDKDLREAGFSGLDGVTLDCPQPNHLLALMTAKPAVDALRERAATILYDNSSLDIAEQLESYLNSEEYVVSLHNLADQVYPTDKDIIAVVDLNRPFFEDIDSSTFNTFRSFVVKVSQSQAGVLWLTGSSQLLCTDPRWAQVIGTARTIRNELSIDLATCEIDKPDPQTWRTVAKIFEKFQKRRNCDTLLPEYEYAIVDGVVHIPRIFPVVVNNELKNKQEEIKDVAYDLTIGKYGRLNTLQWTPRPSRELIGEEVIVDTKAVGMNFKDVLIAMGVIDSNISSLGLEAAGIVRQVGPEVQDLSVGDRVFVLSGGSFSTGLLTSEKLCARIPDCLGFEDAATMPCVFSTVIYGLMHVGRLGAGQTVLIHSACGGVGLAAIQICRMVGAEIYCTVGNDEKTQYLESSFGIPRARIFNSRDASFLADIMRATNGRGVDLVLNSLSGELLHASWNSVAEFGKMIEIGKRDLIGNGKLALNVFELNRSYHGVDLGHLIELKPMEAKRLLKEIAHLYELGHIQPIRPLQTFAADAVGDCFRCMQKGQHIGKIVVSMETSQGQSLAISSPTRAPSFDAHKSYLLVGGLGGLGRVVSNWMVEHGARHLVFLSRSAGESEEDQAFLEEIRSQGCSATAVKGSVTVLENVEAAISAAPTPIRGVLNMSMVLGDQIFSTMSYEEWAAAVEPKVKGTWNLHNACLLQDLDLDFFVLFSSISGIIGQRGQANYAGANTFLDSFVQYRQNLGLKAGSVDIGLITDQGAMAENLILADRLIAQGNFGIRTSQLLDALSVVISMPASKTGRNGAVVHPATLIIGLRSVTPLDDPSNRVIWKGDRRTCVYYNGSASGNSVSKASATSNALADFLSLVIANPDVLNAPDTTVFIAKQIGLQLSTLLLRPVEDDSEADVSRSLQEIGLDSLVAIEMRNWWKGAFEFDISVLEILSMGSLLALGERAVEGLKGKFGENETREDGEGQVQFSVHQILETKMP